MQDAYTSVIIGPLSVNPLVGLMEKEWVEGLLTPVSTAWVVVGIWIVIESGIG